MSIHRSRTVLFLPVFVLLLGSAAPLHGDSPRVAKQPVAPAVSPASRRAAPASAPPAASRSDGNSPAADIAALAEQVAKVQKAHVELNLGTRKPAQAASMPAVLWHLGEPGSSGGPPHGPVPVR